MKDVILARLGEIALKGLNRGKFEQRLMSNLARRLRRIGTFQIMQKESRIWIVPQQEDVDLEEALDITCHVFGIVSASLVKRFEVSEASLLPSAKKFIEEKLKALNPLGQDKIFKFKVEAKRGNKSFPLKSPEISAHVGGYLLSQFPNLKVDVNQPDFILHIEVRDYLYMYCDKKEGLRGLPIGMSSKAMLLLSGGIDSPVAGFMTASRGVEVESIYFHTPPYTSERAKQKVIDLAKILTDYTGQMMLHIVDFTEIQLEINEKCNPELITILMRRMMMRIAEAKAQSRGVRALVTGESLGQVASQTMEALCTTDIVVKMPIFRPLIGLDKEDTVQISKKIGTFETSIQPYEDCCTVFVAKHPKTRPSLEEVEREEEKLDIPSLVQKGLEKIYTHRLRLGDED